MFSMPLIDSEDRPDWTFLSNHAHVLICIAQQPDVRLTEVAQQVGIGERAVHRIVHELSDSGYLSVTKEGRNNVYKIHLNKPLRHPLESHHNIQEIITPLLKKPSSKR